MYLHRVHHRSRGFQTLDLEKRSAFTRIDVIFDKESMLQEKSGTEDKSQGGASNSSTDTQKKIEFSESPKRPGVSDENLYLDGDKQEATQEQPKPLRRSVGISVPPTRYG